MSQIRNTLSNFVVRGCNNREKYLKHTAKLPNIIWAQCARCPTDPGLRTSVGDVANQICCSLCLIEFETLAEEADAIGQFGATRRSWFGQQSICQSFSEPASVWKGRQSHRIAAITTINYCINRERGITGNRIITCLKASRRPRSDLHNLQHRTNSHFPKYPFKDTSTLLLRQSEASSPRSYHHLCH